MNWQLCPRCYPSNAPEQAVQETQHETITSHSRQHHILHQKFLQNHAQPLVQWIELIHVIKQTKRKTQETKLSTGTLGKTRFKTHRLWVHSPVLLGNCPRMTSARPCRVAALPMQTLRRCRPFGRPSAPTAGEFKAENGETVETKLSNITCRNKTEQHNQTEYCSSLPKKIIIWWPKKKSVWHILVQVMMPGSNTTHTWLTGGRKKTNPHLLGMPRTSEWLIRKMTVDRAGLGLNVAK